MKIVLVGQGGHSKVIYDLIRSDTEHQVVGFADDKYDEIYCAEQKYFGPTAMIPELMSKYKGVKLVIAIGNNRIRKIIAERLGYRQDHYATLIHKSAVISPSAKIGYGTVIMPQAVINAGAVVGNHSIINTGAIVEHDNNLSDYVHISPHATLTGGVDVGQGAHVGAGANIIPNIHLGSWTVIGAGATVIEDIPSYTTAVGIPAKIIAKKVIGGV